MRVQCTFSANCGVCLEIEGVKIWIDAVSDERYPYSYTGPSLWEKIKQSPRFQNPGAILFSHCHEDHFSAGLAGEAHMLWPGARVIAPCKEAGDGFLQNDSESFVIEGLTVNAIRSTHEGEEYSSEPHYSFLIGKNDEWIFFSGDAKPGDEMLLDYIKDFSIHTAICIFPWITLGRGRRALMEIIKPQHLLVCHIPFEQDDCLGYRSIVEEMARRHGGFTDTRLLLTPLQEESL